MNVFLDTEFTDIENTLNAKLISIGLVAENGTEFYAELTDTYSPSECSPFVIEAVLPLLWGGAYQMAYQELATKLKAWIESFNTDIILVSDNPPVDFPFVWDIFEKYGWPQNLSKQCEPIYFMVADKDGENFHRALEDFWAQNEKYQHHALWDSRSLLFALSWIKNEAIEFENTSAYKGIAQ